MKLNFKFKDEVTGFLISLNHQNKLYNLAKYGEQYL